MASNPKDPMSRFYEVDIAGGSRSNFNLSYKNRISADFGYLYPVGLWDVPSDSHFELDIFSALSSNPTLGPLLGKVKFRVEAYFVEKAAYVESLRNNDKLPLDRDVPFPTIQPRVRQDEFSPRAGLHEFLKMFPVGWDSRFFNGEIITDATPSLNAIPFIMYYDIYRNYYINPQDPNFPMRTRGFIPGLRNPNYDSNDPDNANPWLVEPTPIVDTFITREDLDRFVYSSRSNPTSVESSYSRFLHVDFLPRIDIGIDGPTEEDHLRYKHYGLLRRTLNNDFFTSFVSNSNVELMKSSSIVSTPGGQISVEQISLANRNWRIKTRSILWGTDWKDYNKVHYGVNLLIPYGKPQFLGAISSDVTFNDVISQAQTGDQDSSVLSNKNLGSRAGLAYGALSSNHFVEFNTKDEGYVMVLASLVPEVDYYQGIDPMYFKTNLKHSWMVELNSVGMQDFAKSWATAVRSETTSTTIPWSSYNEAIHQVPIWFEYMAKYNELHGDFTGANQLRYWVFARPFDSLSVLFPGVFDYVDEQPSYDSNFSTYVLPEMFNYIFANNVGTDNFQLQFNFDCKVSMMLDKQVIAYL